MAGSGAEMRRGSHPGQVRLSLAQLARLLVGLLAQRVQLPLLYVDGIHLGTHAKRGCHSCMLSSKRRTYVHPGGHCWVACGNV